MSGISRAGLIGAMLAAFAAANQSFNLPGIGPADSRFGMSPGAGRNRTAGKVGEPGDKLRKRFAKVSKHQHPGPRGY